VVFSDRQITVGDAFQDIERQTNYLISYTTDGFNLKRKVRLSQNNLPLEKALDQLLSGAKRTYLIRGNHILIVQNKKELPPPLPPVEVVEEPEPVVLPVDAEPEPEAIDLTKPPVDLDSLETALRSRMIVYPAEIPNEPRFDTDAYYSRRDRDRDLNGRPAYTQSMPSLALRTNLLYAAGTLTPNLGVELGLAPNRTLLLGGSYNGWNADGTDTNNDKLCHWILHAEYRHWLCERFNGHFLGAHAFYGYYNIAGKKIPLVLESNSDKYRYKGNGYGVGISYGYQLMLGKNWNVEFNAGIGVGRLQYDKWACDRCGDIAEKNASRIFLAPTKLGISISYIIK